MQIGDHLVTPRTGYTHHGLYIGQQEVIHYEGKNGGTSGQITKASVAEFCDGQPCKVRDYPLRVYGRKESVERAYQRLYESRYNILFNNCEQFVAWCIMGIGYSEQLNDAMSLVIETKMLVDSVNQHQAGQLLLLSGLKSETAREIITQTLPVGSAVTTGMLASGTSTATALIAGNLSIASVTPLVLPIAAGTLVGYGIKKFIEWLD